MAEKKIGAKLVIDGESEFRANLNSAKQAMANLNSELKLVTATYKDNANSLEALRAKQQVYISLQEEQRNKISLLSEMQEKAVSRYEQEQGVLEELGRKRETLNTRLEEAKETYGENSEEVQRLTEELNGVNSEYEAQEKAVQKTSDRVNKYQTDLNNAETELVSLNGEIEDNEKYLVEAERSIDRCATSIDEYGDEVGEAAESTSVFGDVIKAELISSAIKEGLKQLASGIRSIATAAVSTGSSFEASMSNVAATMGITTDEIRQGSEAYDTLSTAAQECGKSTMYSASQAAEALNYLALAGYDAEKSAETLPKVLNLAAAGGLDLAYASDLVTDSMAALGMETDQLDNYIDEMAKTSQKSNTSISQLGEATLVCAGMVSLTGQSLETMNTALGVMANNGTKGAEGGTHLRNILQTLAAPSDTASKAIKQLGLNVYDSSGKMKDLYVILEEMEGLMDGWSDEEKTQTIRGIFNSTDISAVNALLKSTNGEYKNLYAQLEDCSGTAQDMADTLNDNLNGKVTILQSALEGLGITAYGLFDDEMKDAVDAATDAVGRLQDAIDNGDLGVSLSAMSEALGEFADSAVNVAEGAVPKMIDALTWILENADIIAGLIGGITAAKVTYTVATEAATVAQKAFNITASASPYIALATAIAGVVSAVAIYSKTTSNSTASLSDSVKRLTTESKKLNGEAKTATAERAESREALDNEQEACEKLAGTLAILQSKTELTASEQARQQSIIDQLNTAMPELNLYIDEQTGKLNMTKDALYENVDAYMALAKAEAAREDMSEIAQQQYEAEKQLAELRAEETQAVERLNEAEARLNEEAANGGDLIRYSEEAQEAYALATSDLEAIRAQIEETNQTIDELGTEYDETRGIISDNEAITQTASAIDALGDSASETGDEIVEMSAETLEAYNEMYSDLSELIGDQMDLFSEFSSKSELSTSEILKNMQSQVDGISQWADNLEELADRGINQGLLQYLADMGPTGAGYVATFVSMTDEELQKANGIFEEAMMIPSSTALQITDTYYSLGQDMSEAIKEGIEENTDEVLSATEFIALSIPEKIGTMSLLKEAQKQGNYVGDGLALGIEEKADEVFSAAEYVGLGIPERIAVATDSHSPSKETQKLGNYVDDGLILGMTEKQEKVFAAISKIATETLSTAKDGMSEDKYRTVGLNITQGIRSGIESGKSSVLESVRDMCIQTINTAKSNLGIHSPSTEFAYLGEMSGEGYVEGWQQTMRNIDAIITDCLPDVPSISGNVGQAQLESNANLAGMITGAASQQYERLYDMCAKMYEIMSQYIPEMANMQIVTDTGALIGELAPGLDNELGNMAAWKERV